MPGNPQVPLRLFNYLLLIAFLPAADMLGRTRRLGEAGTFYLVSLPSWCCSNENFQA
ncbi:hypothetical protein E2C01_090071 [Portunus trituberculatus]|uniref:Uncharacterized protein n=1 Tax=Portunus trituberculatus TaxID=210409 RepID=A0A5B7JF89_PORTR|nr:hypothetical protein [Portunus trituberculatus]